MFSLASCSCPPLLSIVLQKGSSRQRKLKRHEQYSLRHINKRRTAHLKLLGAEGDRISDVIEVLGQTLGNTGLWIHPDDRKKVALGLLPLKFVLARRWLTSR